MRGFTKKSPEVLERQRAQRREEAIAEGRAIVAASNAALEARLAELREIRLREKRDRRERKGRQRGAAFVAQVQERRGCAPPEVFA